MMDLPSHEVLQDGALPCALSAYHSDLRQVEGAARTHAAQGVLQTIDQRNKILHPPVAHRNGAADLPVGLLWVGSGDSGRQKRSHYEKLRRFALLVTDLDKT